MSLTAQLRTRVQNLILGSYGITKSVSSGRFTLMPEDNQAETLPANISERAIKVHCGFPVELEPVNPVDGFGLYKIAISVSITYAYTNAGGSLAEGLNPQNGAGTKTAITDRATTDYFKIKDVCEWYENWSGLDPEPFNFTFAGDAALAFNKDTAILTFTIDVWVNASHPSVYDE